MQKCTSTLALSLSLLSACGTHAGTRAATQGGAIDAPDATWTWVPTPGAVCANGKGTGFAASLMHDSDDLVIFFEGGGACRNYLECYMFKTAVNIADGYNAATFADERYYIENDWLVTHRDDPKNPFRGMNLAYIPYCTGDLHAGHSVWRYFGAKRDTYHVGGDNAAKYLARLAAALPRTKHIWLYGFSAGGFAATLNRAAAGEAFPQARIDILDDSGISFSDAPPIPRSWNITRPPDACEGCDVNMARVGPFIAKAFPQSRFGFISFATDTVLPNYLYQTEEQFSDNLSRYTEYLDDLAAPNLQYFIVEGEGHVALHDGAVSTQGMELADWVGQMATDKPDWKSYKPAGF